MPAKSDIKQETDAFKISIDAQTPSEDAILEHWLLIADTIKKIDQEKQCTDSEALQ